jgi:ParB-like chromosome segregation protein Spo0J
MMDDVVPLAPLHADERLIASKLETYRKLPTEVLVESLKPGQVGALKARPDGTILDGHHRLKALRERGFDVNRLPREIVPKAPLD